MTALIVAPEIKTKVKNIDWSKISLRKCLRALGVSDDEMRFRKGALSIMDSWTGEADVLLSIAKKHWKERVVEHHEANGGDPEQWRLYNLIYETAKSKISRRIKKPKKIATRKTFKARWRVTPHHLKQRHWELCKIARLKRLARETPEQRIARLKKQRDYFKQYYNLRKATGNPIYRKKIKPVAFEEKMAA